MIMIFHDVRCVMALVMSAMGLDVVKSMGQGWESTWIIWMCQIFFDGLVGHGKCLMIALGIAIPPRKAGKVFDILEGHGK